MLNLAVHVSVVKLFLFIGEDFVFKDFPAILLKVGVHVFKELFVFSSERQQPSVDFQLVLG